jgi:hypothetical protein
MVDRDVQQDRHSRSTLFASSTAMQHMMANPSRRSAIRTGWEHRRSAATGGDELARTGNVAGIACSIANGCTRDPFWLAIASWIGLGILIPILGLRAPR